MALLPRPSTLGDGYPPFVDLYPDHAEKCLEIVGSSNGIFLFAGRVGNGRAVMLRSLVVHLVDAGHNVLVIDSEVQDPSAIDRIRRPIEEMREVIAAHARAYGNCIMVLPGLTDSYSAELAAFAARYGTVFMMVVAPTAGSALKQAKALMPDSGHMARIIGVMAKQLFPKKPPFEGDGRFALVECLDLRDGSAGTVADQTDEEHDASFADIGKTKVDAGILDLSSLQTAFHRLPASYWQASA